ncbi:hypothetical protein AUJ84_00015 [Candidatus Pacearchaeota archaeon CG1_02_32_132]|nr:MAG: hypothetical protein AUJ84_00015 [Candidatus Pacearchaeota archaeon CG1_02_32_132]
MTSEKVEIIRRELAQLFRHAYEGRASLSLVYDVGERLGSRVDTEEIPNVLSDALEFVHGLHDQSARTYHTRKKDQLYHHMRQLSQ